MRDDELPMSADGHLSADGHFTSVEESFVSASELTGDVEEEAFSHAGGLSRETDRLPWDDDGSSKTAIETLSQAGGLAIAAEGPSDGFSGVDVDICLWVWGGDAVALDRPFLGFPMPWFDGDSWGPCI